MNIKEAKQEILNTVLAYRSRNDAGLLMIPKMKQRPIFLMGAPGIGKTAIMEQVADEASKICYGEDSNKRFGLLSYSMTHHTRQSVLGLPSIVHKQYPGIECDVTEYTMSEIISSIYDVMVNSKCDEGILFLDEINCVSETLAPIMLRFLQEKKFGCHEVPDGWIIVTAGNPPEYNNSVREFDVVTWDRLKRIDIEPDFNVWKEYAYNHMVHPAVISYLDIKKDNFYIIESTVNGKSFVTARGWDDLSSMIRLYEMNHIPVKESLVIQYLQNPKIAKDFAVYYDLFNKYKSSYQVDNILNGTYDQSIVNRAQKSKFDERISLISLILDGLNVNTRAVVLEYNTLDKVRNSIGKFSARTRRPDIDLEALFNSMIEENRSVLKNAKSSGSLSRDETEVLASTIKVLEDQLPAVTNCKDGKNASVKLRQNYEKSKSLFLEKGNHTAEMMNNIFMFLEDTFGEGNEMLVTVTELTSNKHTAKFLSLFKCDKYYEHNRELQFYERQNDIDEQLKLLDDGSDLN